MDLTEAEDIKKKWQEYTEELYKKDFHDPDNHDGMNTHLEPDILQSRVKWTLGSITTNKASGGHGILVQLFQILKDNAVKVLHSICQQIWKTQQPKRRGSLRCLPPLEVRPSSVAPDPAESRGAPPPPQQLEFCHLH